MRTDHRSEGPQSMRSPAPASDTGSRAGCLPIPWLRTRADGSLFIELRRPSFHTMVFGSNLVALAEIVLARFGGLPLTWTISVFPLIVVVAFVLGRLAAVRFKDRTSRICTSGMSLTALALNVTPGALAPSGFNGPVKMLAVATMLVFAAGTALIELLHRSALRAGWEVEQQPTTKQPTTKQPTRRELSHDN